MSSVADLVRERFGELTEIQKLAIPRVLAGENVLILAPTGSGKCVSGETIVFTDKGPVKIEDIYQEAVEVNSLNPKLRVELSKGIVIRKRKSELFKVATESGREVRVTDDHKFLVLKNGVLGWDMLKNLKKGEYIGCARQIKIKEDSNQYLSLGVLKKWDKKICIKTNPDISELIRSVKKKNGNIGLRKIAPLLGRHRATIMRAKKNFNMQVSTYLKLAELSGEDPESIRITEISGAGFNTLKVPEMDDDLAYFTGLFAGDGNFNNSSVRFTTSSPELLAFFKNYCGRLGLSVKKDESRKFDYYTCSKALYVILNSLGIDDKGKSAKIRIPPMFFRKRSLLAAFIRGLFDTDGSVNAVIEYCTKSKQMAREVQLALLCFGILSDLKIKRHKKYGPYYRVFIRNSENICKFVSLIGFGHPAKLLKAKKFIGKASNPNKDVIPNMAGYLKAYKEKLGISYSRLRVNRRIESYMYGYRNPSRRGLENVLDDFSDLRETEQSSFLRQLSTSDIFWDKISDITHTGEDYVYDATVPGNSNFIGNGIILHNTECALLPVLEKIQSDESGICALYITPLRALSRDLLKRFHWWCERLDISHDVRTGDTTLAERAAHRKNPPKILLTTVESLQALLLGRVMRRHLANVRFVIVDEVHDVLDNKRGAQLSLGLERLGLIANFQRIGISATVANEMEAARLLFGDRMYAVCEVGKNRKMDISVEMAGETDKLTARMKELAVKHRALMFVNTRSMAEELSASLKKAEAPIDVHHGSLAKDVRLAAEDGFKSGSLRSLLSTSSLELGIDIGDVELVVQVHSPHQVFRLIQRVGRSGHSLDKTPKGIVLSSDLDDYLESEVIRSLAENGWMEHKHAEKGALDVIGHQLIGLCLDLGRLELKKAHEILSRSYAYGITYDQLRRVALQLYGESLVYYDEHPDGSISIRIRPRAREYYYSNLSTIPKEKRYALREISSNSIIASLDENFVANLELGASFLAKGQPWQVIDITEKEVLAQPSSASDVAIPEWTGEDIPVEFEVAQGVGSLRKSVKKDIKPMPDDKTVIIEIVSDIIIVHACFGTKVNEGLARLFSVNLSRIIGESVRAVADPYRIMVKLPFPLGEEHIMRAWDSVKSVRSSLEEALSESYLLRMKFIHVGRLFGMLSEDASVSGRFISALRYSAVYDEAVRSVFFRYFDVKRTEDVLAKIRKKEIRLIIDKRDKPSYFAKLGLDRISSKESMGGFEPREAMVTAFKGRALSKTLQLQCLHCGATRYLHLAGAPEQLACHKCGEKAYTLIERDGEPQDELRFKAGLIRAYGKKALIALSTYGIGATTADRVLKKLHRDEQGFYLDLIEAQKNFIKNKRFWKP